MEYITLNNGAVITNEVLAGIGQKYGKTPAQVALRALMQKGVVVIPKSAHLRPLRFQRGGMDAGRVGEKAAARRRHAVLGVAMRLCGVLR